MALVLLRGLGTRESTLPHALTYSEEFGFAIINYEHIQCHMSIKFHVFPSRPSGGKLNLTRKNRTLQVTGIIPIQTKTHTDRCRRKYMNMNAGAQTHARTYMHTHAGRSCQLQKVKARQVHLYSTFQQQGNSKRFMKTKASRQSAEVTHYERTFKYN